MNGNTDLGVRNKISCDTGGIFVSTAQDGEQISPHILQKKSKKSIFFL